MIIEQIFNSIIVYNSISSILISWLIYRYLITLCINGKKIFSFIIGIQNFSWRNVSVFLVTIQYCLFLKIEFLAVQLTNYVLLKIFANIQYCSFLKIEFLAVQLNYVLLKIFANTEFLRSIEEIPFLFFYFLLLADMCLVSFNNQFSKN